MPACLAQLARPDLAGETWAGAALTLTEAVAERDRCLRLVSEWIEAERAARAATEEPAS